MFCRRRHSLWSVLLLLFGFKVMTRERWSESEKQAYFEKRRLFRSKLREAFDVWDAPPPRDSSNDVNEEN